MSKNDSVYKLNMFKLKKFDDKISLIELKL